MSDAISYLLAVDEDRTQALEIARGSALKLESNQISLIEIVQSLQEYINDENASIRSKAVNYLSQVVTILSPEFLTRQQILVLCQFLCDRIEDEGAVTGLLKLQSLSRYNKDMAIMTLRAMLEKFPDLQVRSQTQRFQIFELLNSLLSNHRLAIKALGPESLTGVVDLVAGEKDPRDLMVVFAILEVLIAEWDIAGQAETVFDAVFCYFPITFRPPPDDPYGITAQDLKDRLRGCIAASYQLAPYAFPQLLEKLDSTSSNVKVDVLRTISACVVSYGPSVVSNYSTSLWESLKYEVFNVQEDHIASEALSVLQAIADQLARATDPVVVRTPLAIYLDPIINECKSRLLEPQHKQAKPASQILSAVIHGSSEVLRAVVAEVIPPLVTLYQDADTIEKRRSLLESLSQLLESGRFCSASRGLMSSSIDDNPIHRFKDQLFEIFSQALMSTVTDEISLRMLALRCLLLLCTFSNLLGIDEIGMVVQYFNEIIIMETANTRHDLRDAAIDGLVDISRLNSSLILDVTFPVFLARLPTSIDREVDDYDTLECLARISVEPQLANTLVRRLFRLLDHVLHDGGSSKYCHAILVTLTHVFSQKDRIPKSDNETHFEKAVELIKRAAEGTREPTALNQIHVLDSLGRLTCRIIHAAGPSKQNIVAQQIYALFANHPIFVTLPSQVNVSDARRSSIILSTYLLAAIKSDIPIPHLPDKLYEILDDLIMLSIHESSAPIRRSLLQHITLLVNKYTPPQQLHTILSIIEGLKYSMSNLSRFSTKFLQVIFWLSKALVMRSSATNEVMDQLVGLLENVNYGTEAARGFTVLLAPDEIVCRENGANTRLLAPQRIFNICVPAIANMFQRAETFAKSNYLIALSGIINHIDPGVFLPEISTVLPLLLQSLELDDQVVKSATIETLMIVSQESPGALEEHVPTLINRLTTIATNPQNNRPKTRRNALHCLRGLPGKVVENNLLPYRKTITRGIQIALDDPKREVRKEAVDCQASWMKLDDPEEDN